jgi:BASS family bile acid:Na+ symporter
MLGMGALLAPRDFAAVLRAPRALALGLAIQLVLVPLAALGLARWLPLPPGIAAGVVLVAAVPGGTLSNLFTFLGRGNLPLSISLTAVTTVGALATTPGLLRLLLPELGDFEMPTRRIAAEIAATLLAPLALGMALGGRLPERRAALSRWAIRASLCAIALMVIGAGGSGRLDPRAFGAPALATVLLLPLANAVVALLACRLARVSTPDGVALAIEATIRNTNLALLVKAALRPAVAGAADPLGDGMLFAALLYGGGALGMVLPLLAWGRRADARAARPPAPGAAPP